MRYPLFIMVVSILLVRTTCIYSQKAWLSETPQGYANEYFVGSGTSTFSEPEAEELAYKNALKKISDSRGIIFEPTEDVMKYYSKQTELNNHRNNERILEIGKSFKITNKATIIENLKIWDRDSKYEGRLHSVWLLVSVPKENPSSPPSPLSPVWRSFIVSGWGQFYKGEPGKGYFFLGTTVLSLSSGLIFSNLKITSQSDANNSRTQAMRDYYNANTNTYNNISLACFIAAAAIYVYNLIDAIAAEGEKVYAYNPNNSNYEASYKLSDFPNPQSLISIRMEF